MDTNNSDKDQPAMTPAMKRLALMNYILKQMQEQAAQADQQQPHSDEDHPKPQAD